LKIAQKQKGDILLSPFALHHLHPSAINKHLDKNHKQLNIRFSFITLALQPNTPSKCLTFGVVQNTVTDFWLIDNCAPFLSHENNDEIILQ